MSKALVSVYRYMIMFTEQWVSCPGGKPTLSSLQREPLTMHVKSAREKLMIIL